MKCFWCLVAGVSTRVLIFFLLTLKVRLLNFLRFIVTVTRTVIVSFCFKMASCRGACWLHGENSCNEAATSGGKIQCGGHYYIFLDAFFPLLALGYWQSMRKKTWVKREAGAAIVPKNYFYWFAADLKCSKLDYMILGTRNSGKATKHLKKISQPRQRQPTQQHPSRKNRRKNFSRWIGLTLTTSQFSSTPKPCKSVTYHAAPVQVFIRCMLKCC